MLHLTNLGLKSSNSKFIKWKNHSLRKNRWAKEKLMDQGRFQEKSTLKVRYSKKNAPNPLIKGEQTNICNRIHKIRAASLIFTLRYINRGLTVNSIPSITKDEGKPTFVFLHYRKSGASARLSLYFKGKILVFPLSHYQLIYFTWFGV